VNGEAAMDRAIQLAASVRRRTSPNPWVGCVIVAADGAVYEGATQPGFQESFSSMFPAPRQRWVESMTVPDDEIRKLPHRTLIVHGREDQVIPLETSLKLLQLLDNADLSVYSHCGHWSMIERRDDFNRQVRDFFLSN